MKIYYYDGSNKKALKAFTWEGDDFAKLLKVLNC